jgi:predicted transcriptional regulator
MKNIIASIMKKLNISQADLANLLGVSQSTVYGWLGKKKDPSQEHKAILLFLDKMSKEQLEGILREYYRIQLQIQNKAQSGDIIASALIGQFGLPKYVFFLYLIIKMEG